MNIKFQRPILTWLLVCKHLPFSIPRDIQRYIASKIEETSGSMLQFLPYNEFTMLQQQTIDTIHRSREKDTLSMQLPIHSGTSSLICGFAAYKAIVENKRVLINVTSGPVLFETIGYLKRNVFKNGMRTTIMQQGRYNTVTLVRVKENIYIRVPDELDTFKEYEYDYIVYCNTYDSMGKFKLFTLKTINIK